ncbi:MAG: tRNA (N(6)-L-threonylcarbamoyladenosine(37)-C(2))-methylthiotransferase MtaB [Desulfobacterales bacterium]|nr:MAG: tRNA (N(6)-L-threonylcarbamoyladenosine(37)-C(2))-methylthiotransferase MtaB [Desulfobacterales bacterium]
MSNTQTHIKGRQQAATFTITTLGCKVNQYESEAIAQQLSSDGYRQVRQKQTTDLCIINTCTVTQKAAMQSRQAIRKAMRANPGARIIVTGCYAQTETDAIKKIKGVDHIIGHADKHNIPDIIPLSDENTQHPVTVINRDIFLEHDFKAPSTTVLGNRTRPILKIQDGCDSRCTYCIVPLARGQSRSMPVASVLQHIQQLKQAGYHEVVLSGVHLGAYGTDLPNGIDLYSLLNRIHEQNGMDRVRLSSIEPLELTDDIITLVAESSMFCHHFHIPLQSGDDDVLKKMNRPYTRALFQDLIIKINKHLPDAAIGVDTLIGFPGETENAFANTYALLENLPVTYLHVFPFSARGGTPASMFPGKVPATVIKTRCQIMRQLGDVKKRAFYQKFIGQKLNVLMEDKRDKSTGCLKGITANYIPVHVPWDEKIKNTLVQVSIDTLDSNNTVFGTLC